MMMMTTMMMMMMMKVTQPEQPERPHLRSWPYGPDQDSWTVADDAGTEADQDLPGPVLGWGPPRGTQELNGLRNIRAQQRFRKVQGY